MATFIFTFIIALGLLVTVIGSLVLFIAMAVRWVENPKHPERDRLAIPMVLLAVCVWLSLLAATTSVFTHS